MTVTWFKKTSWGQWEITERIKFRIARLLDRIPSLCWSRLVLWALNIDPWWAIFAVLFPSKSWLGFHAFNDQSCRWVNIEQYPYCGKCWNKDRWLTNCTPEQREAALKYTEEFRPKARQA